MSLSLCPSSSSSTPRSFICSSSSSRLSTFRITAKYFSIARDLGPLPKARSLAGGRRRPLPFGPIPSFSEVISQVRSFFNFPPTVQLGFRQVDFSPASSFPLLWKDWDRHTFLPSTYDAWGDWLVLGRNIRDSGLWESMLDHRRGPWGGSFLRGHLVLDVVVYGSQRQIPLLPPPVSLPSHVDLTMGAIAALLCKNGQQIRIPEDLRPILQVVSFEAFDSFEKVSRRRVRCVLSDGIHYVQVWIPFETNERFLAIAEDNMIIQANEVTCLENDHLVLKVFDRISSSTVRIGAPIPINAPRGDFVRLPFLPPEILRLVFEALSKESRSYIFKDPTESRKIISALSRCTSVSSSWNIIATPQLYRHITLRTLGADRVALRLALETRPERARFSRTLCAEQFEFVEGLPAMLSDLMETYDFTSLTIVTGIVLNRASGYGFLDLVAVRLPALRDLEFTLTASDGEPFSFATVNLPTSIQKLSARLDCPANEMDVVLRKFVETGDVPSNGVAVRRSLPNLVDFGLHFFVRDDEEAHLSSNSTLLALNNLLEHLRPTLTTLRLSEIYESEPPPLSECSSFPNNPLSSSPSLQTLSLNCLTLSDFLLSPTSSYASLETILVGPEPGDANTRYFSYGAERFRTNKVEDLPDGGIVWEIIEHVEKERLPKLRKVQLVLADWGRPSHRSLPGLDENGRSLEAFGIDLVDRNERHWWEKEEGVGFGSWSGSESGSGEESDDDW
ncbi:hypothetical protein BDY24DRAFT_89198 [Mrakia frigida]|uniref:uncharacterized protein n=1 Tax=Mrakia frigida TaxID=29902 RepID=UPI003FCC2715